MTYGGNFYLTFEAASAQEAEALAHKIASQISADGEAFVQTDTILPVVEGLSLDGCSC